MTNAYTYSSAPLPIHTHTHTQVLSNIHTVRAVWLPTEERSWKFSPRAQSSTDSLLHPVGVVRMNSEDTNIGESDWFQCVFFTSQLFVMFMIQLYVHFSELLFELGVTFQREVNYSYCLVCMNRCTLCELGRKGRDRLHVLFDY